FYVLPQYRAHVFDLFEALLAESRATMIEVQTNDVLLTVMLHLFAHNIESESIVFEDRLTTALVLPGVIFRRITDENAAAMSPPQTEIGDWVLETDGKVVARGGLLYHYNRPYGDIHMGVE